MVGVNFWGVVHGLRAFVPRMIAQDEEGHVVNTSSVAGLALGGGIYGATKHAVTALTEAVFVQFLQKHPKLGASVLCPGHIRTNLGATSRRNRPPGSAPADAARAAAGGPPPRPTIRRDYMEPPEVADMVFRAIRERRLYVVTHTVFDDMIRRRMDNILERRNPDLSLVRDLWNAQSLK
jgi:NAD(P)-dependent dehydrogenase (short-subunit alcohol dehydrogenase family)